MKREREIEIYVRGCSIPQLLAWVEVAVGPLAPPEKAGDSIVYASRVGPVVITPSVEGGPFVSVWFNTPGAPWTTDVDCARDAAKNLDCIVRCDPGQRFPGVPVQADVLLEISGTTEQLVPL